MKYENAKDILPNHLVEELQQYAAGRLLYVAAVDEKKGWGECSGIREKLKKRNVMIRNKYAHGITITELAEEYYLSLDSIKKIIYSEHNERKLVYRKTVESAVGYAEAGMLEEWLQSYHIFTKQNDQIFIQSEQQSFFGVVKLPLRLIHMEDNYEIEIKKTWDLIDLNIMELPPLIVTYENRAIWCLSNQKSLFLGLKQSGRNTYPAIILIYLFYPTHSSYSVHKSDI